MTDKTILLDTNILVYAVFEDGEFYNEAREVVDKALTGQINAFITPQNLSELYAVITDPKRVDNPLTPEQAYNETEVYLKSAYIRKRYIKFRTVEKTLELAKKYKVKGSKIFDMQLVAIMLDNGIGTIYTVNIKDFKNIEEIQAVNPLE